MTRFSSLAFRPLPNSLMCRHRTAHYPCGHTLTVSGICKSEKKELARRLLDGFDGAPPPCPENVSSLGLEDRPCDACWEDKRARVLRWLESNCRFYWNSRDLDQRPHAGAERVVDLREGSSAVDMPSRPLTSDAAESGVALSPGRDRLPQC